MLRLNRLSRINIVTTTKPGRTPGRPRQFDAEQAIETAQRLFHARGYDAVSVADLTQAFGINPPSFYAAFGSKLGLYTRVLQRYSQMVKVGGLLVYATCSILPEENRQQVDKFLAANEHFRLIGDHNVSPAETGFDGFYMARLERIA